MQTKIDLYVIDRVRELRLENKYTQESLSYALGYSSSFISQFENSDCAYNVEHLNELAKVFDCSPKDFLPDKAI